MGKNGSDSLLDSIRRIQESPALRALREIERSSRLKSLVDSSALRALEELNKTALAVQFAELDQSASLRAIRELTESPALRALREFEARTSSISQSCARLVDTSSIDETAKLLQKSPFLKAVEDLQNSSSFQVIGQLAETFSSRLAGPLTLGSAYAEVLRTFQEIDSAAGTDALNELWEEIEERVQAAPPGALSKEFYLALLFSGIFFLLSQASSIESNERIIESNERIIERIEQMEQVVIAKFEEFQRQESSDTFYVVLRAVRVREGPSTSQPIITLLPPNVKVRLVERAGKWIKVEYFDYTKDQYVIGWSFKKYLKILNPKDSRCGF